MNVPVTEAAIYDLYDLASRRNDPKERFNKHSSWRTTMDARGKADSAFNHLVGLLGEYAAGRVMGNTDVDRRVWADKGDENEGDLTLVCGGVSVQVKTRARRGWDFALGGASITELRAELAVLVYPGNDDTEAAIGAAKLGELLRLARAGALVMDVFGFATRQTFLRMAHHRDYGYGDRLVLAPHHFTPFRRYVSAQQMRDLAKS